MPMAETMTEARTCDQDLDMMARLNKMSQARECMEFVNMGGWSENDISFPCGCSDAGRGNGL